MHTDLTEIQKQVLLLYYQHGWTYRRIAEEIGCTEQNVGQIFSRIHKILGVKFKK